MLYTEQSLAAELARIYRAPSRTGFMQYEIDDKKTNAMAQATTLDDIVKYCWTVYDKAYKASGPQIIGRLNDIHRTLKEKVANIMGGQTLLHEATRGNVLKVDRWSLTVNDCWILGGIHRRASFALMSDYTWKNVWSPDIQGFVVTAREVIGLQTFGYVRAAGTKLGPGSTAVATYVSGDERAALAADLESYQLAVALLESRGPMATVDLVNLGARR